MGNETRASILMSFIIRTARALEAIKTAKQALFVEEIGANKKKNEVDVSNPKEERR